MAGRRGVAGRWGAAERRGMAEGRGVARRRAWLGGIPAVETHRQRDICNWPEAMPACTNRLIQNCDCSLVGAREIGDMKALGGRIMR